MPRQQTWRRNHPRLTAFRQDESFEEFNNPRRSHMSRVSGREARCQSIPIQMSRHIKWLDGRNALAADMPATVAEAIRSATNKLDDEMPRVDCFVRDAADLRRWMGDETSAGRL
jgi:hypothetical protein